MRADLRPPDGGDGILFAIEPACEAFEAAWQAGARPRIETFLTGVDEPLRRALFEELVALDVAYRRGAGEAADPAEYGRRFPEYADLPPDRHAARGLPARVGGYVILRELGRGGMGVVYEATQAGLDRSVALKVLPREVASTPAAVERFRREARAAARLHHTSIVPVFDVGEDRGLLYYTMQLIAGLPLDRLFADLVAARAAAGGLTRPNPAATPANGEAGSTTVAWAVAPDLARRWRERRDHYWREVARIGIQVAGALDHAHARGVIHRDVKPSNLILDGAGTVWVTDFGLARLDEGDLTLPGDVVGTLRYMAPERFAGVVDARCDVYALAVTLYELLTLTRAFGSGDRAALVDEIARRDLQPRAVDPSIPRDLDTIVMRGLAKDPAARYQSAGSFADDLRRFLEDRPIRARRASAPERLLRWARRNRALAASLAAVAALLVTVAAGSFVFGTAQARLRADAEAAREAARRRQYEAEMGSAGTALRATSGAGRIRQLVAAWRPRQGEVDLRGFEWHFLARYADPGLRAFPSEVVCHGIQWPEAARLFRLESRRLLALDARTGEVLRTFANGPGPGPVYADISRSGLVALGGEDGRSVRIVDTASGAVLRELRGISSPRNTTFGQDDTLLAVLSEDGVVVWRWRAAEPLTTIACNTPPAFSPDGTRLSVRIRGETALSILDTRTWETVLRIPAAGTVHAWSPDGALLAVADISTVYLHAATDGALLATLNGHDHEPTGIRTLAWSPDGAWLASGSTDSTVRIWARAGTAKAVLRGHDDHVGQVGWSPDGRYVVSNSGERGTVRVSDPFQRPAVRRLEPAQASQPKPPMRRMIPPAPLAWRPDGGAVVNADGAGGRPTVWDPATGSAMAAESLHCWSPDGRFVACQGHGGVVVHDTTGERRSVAIAEEGASTHSIAWDPLRPRLAWSRGRAAAGEVRIWEPWAGAPRVVTATPRDSYVSFAPDGALLAVWSFEPLLRLVDPETGRDRHGLAVGNQGVNSVAWDPRGERVAVGTTSRTLRVWTPRTGEVRELEGHASRVWSVAFSPDGRRLASASRDGTVRLWDPETGREVLALQCDTELLAVAFSPDGHQLAAVGMDGVLTLWDGAPVDATGRADHR